jgi:hypothetical protein
MSGRLSDYKRLRQVQEEALAGGWTFLLKNPIEAAKPTPFPSSRRE